MELIQTDDQYIFLQLTQIQGCDTALWCSRHTGEFTVRKSWDLASESNPECLGTLIGLVGKISLDPSMEEQLVVIKESDRLGELPESDLSGFHPVYRIRTVVLIPISLQPFIPDTPLKPCPKHHTGKIDLSEVPPELSNNKFPFKSLSGKIKTAGNSIKTTANTAAAGLASQVKVPWKRENGSKNLEKLEKRLHEELLKLFNESSSFYFSLGGGDLTNSLQRRYAAGNKGLPAWQRADDRFFFNKSMLKGIFDLGDSRVDPWILPVIQGFVEVRKCSLSEEFVEELLPETRLPPFYTLILVSRRSQHRAGTRYKRRGVDDLGHVANFVETEQILLYHTHALSFVQVRGSIPLYWSQPGIKYRPPPRIHKDDVENQKAFSAHFQSLFDAYGGCINCISLVERTGRERVLSDTFLEHVLVYNQPRLSYISFDFHEHCRGMRFENVALLMDTIEELIMRTGYFWVDSHGKVMEQDGVFRVNCVDCLDRTNVVQTAIARKVVEIQLAKLGVVQPEVGLCSSEKTVFQAVWANNGDSISRQYAGTNALKGDYTRTGERNLSGLMKDGVNSASRYYLNHMKDSYRQAAIDIVTGNEIAVELLQQVEAADKPLEETEAVAATTDHVRAVVEDCKRMLMQDTDNVIGSWGLIDADGGTADQEGMDVVLILTPDSYYMARYDEDLDKIVDYQHVPLADVTKVEFGVPEQSFHLGFLNNKNKDVHCFRIHYKIGDATGFYHMFRSTAFRFFNNLVLSIATEDEKIESLKAIADAVAVTMETEGLVPDMWFGPLDKRRSRPLDPGGEGGATRPSRMRNVGTLALTSVSSQISRLNPIGMLMKQQQERFNPIRFTDLQRELDRTSLDDAATNRIEDVAAAGAKYAPGISAESAAAKANAKPEITVSQSPNLTRTRVRKISKSSEDLSSSPLSSNPIENVLTPFARLSQGLHSLGSNLDSHLSRSCEQFVGLEQQQNSRDKLTGLEQQQNSRDKLTGLEQHISRDKLTGLQQRSREKSQIDCKSLILNI